MIKRVRFSRRWQTSWWTRSTTTWRAWPGPSVASPSSAILWAASLSGVGTSTTSWFGLFWCRSGCDFSFWCRSGPGSGSPTFNYDQGYGSGSALIWVAGSGWAEDFSCSLCLQFFDPKNKNKKFKAVNFFPIFGHQNPRFGTVSGSEIRKNVWSGSALNQCGSTTLRMTHVEDQKLTFYSQLCQVYIIFLFRQRRMCQ